MRRLISLFFLLFAFYFLPLSLAAPTLQFQNEQTQPGETILATITTPGDFTSEIEETQIQFLEGRKTASFDFDITYYNNTHYLYIYTNKEGNFTIQIQNILFRETDILQSATITQDFTIQTSPITINQTTNQTATQILQIKPGFIFTSSTPTLKLLNLGDLQLNITYNETIITLSPQQTKQITYPTNKTLSTLNFETYKTFQIPIIFVGQLANQTIAQPINQTQEETQTLKPEINTFQITAYQNNETTNALELFNFAETNLTEIKTTSNLNFIQTSTPEILQAKTTQNLTIITLAEETGYFNDTIAITYTENQTQKQTQIKLEIFILPENTSYEDFTVRNETCADIYGQICQTGTICNGTAIFTSAVNPEYCCLATCVETNQSSNSSSSSLGWIIGIVIILALAGGGYYFYKKQKKIVPETTQQQFQKQEQQFNKRITGGLTKT